MSPGAQQERLDAISARIVAAAERAGRDPADVEVVAATKSRTPDEIREFLACAAGTLGVAALGENRVQEALPKIDALADLERPWHFIGALQTNKVKFLAGRFDVVQSVDRPALIDTIARRAPEVRVLVQVNVSGESTKSGAIPGEAAGIARAAIDAGLGVDGLMTMAPHGDPDAARRAFAGLRAVRDSTADELGIELPELSMGMSDDFEIAVEEGATKLRLGRILFGPRRRPNAAPNGPQLW